MGQTTSQAVDASAPSAIFGERLANGDYRAEASKALDKLGGANRQALKKGQSFQKRLEWLQDKLKEQGEEIHEALDKDPLAGRHELLQQEQIKAAQGLQYDAEGKPLHMGHKGTVKEWAGKKHVSVRAQMRKEVLEKEQQLGANRMYLLSGSGATPPPAAQGQQPAAYKQPDAGGAPGPKGWNNNTTTVAERESRKVLRNRIQDYYRDLEQRKKEANSLTLRGVQKQVSRKEVRGESRPGTAAAPGDDEAAAAAEGGEAPAAAGGGRNWREAIAGAKKNAWRKVAPMVKLQVQSRVKPNKGITRHDSFSFFVNQVLGSELRRFQEESVKYDAHLKAAEEARAQLDAIHRARHALEVQAQAAAADSAAAAAAESTSPTSLLPDCVTPHGGQSGPGSPEKSNGGSGARMQLPGLNNSHASRSGPAAMLGAGSPSPARLHASAEPTLAPQLEEPGQTSGSGKQGQQQQQQQHNPHRSSPPPAPSAGTAAGGPRGALAPLRQTGAAAANANANAAASLSASWDSAALAAATAPLRPLRPTPFGFGSAAPRTNFGPSSTNHSGPQAMFGPSGIAARQAAVHASDARVSTPPRRASVAGTPSSSIMSFDTLPSPPSKLPSRAAGPLRASISGALSSQQAQQAQQPPSPAACNSTSSLPLVPESPRTTGGKATSPQQQQQQQQQQQPLTLPAATSVRKSVTDASLILDVDQAELEREAELVRKLGAEMHALSQPIKLMTMYAHRVNARWPEAQDWEPPMTHFVQGFQADAGGGTARVFRDVVQKMLRSGGFAIQLMAGDDYVRMADVRTPVSLWSADPWEMLSHIMPVRAASMDHVCGVTLGVRALMALSGTAEALAGKEAVAKLCVVIHVNNEQEPAVVEDLRAMRWCGLDPRHVIVVPEPRRAGYAFHVDQARFVKRPNSVSPSGLGLQQNGSGYCMLQLAYANEGFLLLPEAPPPPPPAPEPTISGPPPPPYKPPPPGPPSKVPLPGSVLDYLETQGATWLITRRLHDLSLYPPEGTIDLDALAYGLFLSEQHGANMTVQVDLTPNPKMAGSLKSSEAVVLAHRNHRPHQPPPARGTGNGIVGGTANASVFAPSEPPPGTPVPVVAIKGSDLQTPGMISLAGEMKTLDREGKLAASTGRYVTSLAHLKTLVTSLAAFRPSLDFRGGAVYVQLDAADLTSAPSTHCVAITNRAPARTFASVEDANHLLAAVHAQDCNRAFRRLLGAIVAGADGDERVSSITAAPAAGSAAAVAAAGGLGSPSWRSGSMRPTPPTPNGASSAGMSPVKGFGGGGAPLKISVTGSGGTVFPTLASPQGGNGSAAPPLSPQRTPGGGGGFGAPLSPSSGMGGASALSPDSGDHNALYPQPQQHTSPTSSSSGAAATPTGATARRVPPGGQRVLVMAANNASTQGAVGLALSLLRPGKDVLHLMTVVQSPLYEADGWELCRRFEMLARETLTQTQCDVVVKSTSSSTVDQLEAYVNSSGADLVIMGSEELAANTIPMGSVSIGLLKAIHKPIILVKANAKNAKIDWSRDVLKCMVQVEHNTRPLLKYVCSKIVNAARGDQLFLARGNAIEKPQDPTVNVTATATPTARRLLDNFADIAGGLRFEEAVRKPLEGSFEEDGCSFADKERMHIIAVQAAVGRPLPEFLLKILKTTQSAVLVYKAE